MSVRSVAQAGLSGVGKRPGLTAAYDRSSFPGNFELISRVEVGAGGAASIEFTGIPSTFSHLQVRLIGRSTNDLTYDNLIVYFNADTTGANYSRHLLYGNGSSVIAAGDASSVMGYNYIGGGSNAANIFGAALVDVLDYASTSKNATMRAFSGWDANGAGFSAMSSGCWYNTAAVSSVRLVAGFAQFSRASLYGVIRNG